MLTLCKYDLRKSDLFIELGKGATSEGEYLFRAANVWLLLFVFQSMLISSWVSRIEIAEFPDSVRQSAL